MITDDIGIMVIRDDEAATPVSLVPGADCAVALIWPGMGARHRSMHRISLRPGMASVILQHESDSVYYVVKGAAEVVDVDDGHSLACNAGSAVHIDAGTRYQLRAGTTPATVVGGACPADPRLYEEAAPDGHPADGHAPPPPRGTKITIRRVHRDDVQPGVPLISADARLLIWPGTGANYANMNWVRLEPGESNIPHRHAESEDTIYIIEGKGTVENTDTGDVYEFGAGDAVYVSPGVRHSVRADRGVPVISVGGPAPPDWTMVRSINARDLSLPDTAGAEAEES